MYGPTSPGQPLDLNFRKGETHRCDSSDSQRKKWLLTNNCLGVHSPVSVSGLVGQALEEVAGLVLHLFHGWNGMRTWSFDLQSSAASLKSLIKPKVPSLSN